MTSTDGKTTYKADGSFGGATERAVIEYQKKNGLEPDGSVGKATWKRLLRV
jgi:peptidoglycan hydrolase-like protein with peptidoglycan-binding domain